MPRGPGSKKPVKKKNGCVMPWTSLKSSPEEGEEERLAEERQFLMHGEKLVAALNDAGSELSRGKGC